MVNSPQPSDSLPSGPALHCDGQACRVVGDWTAQGLSDRRKTRNLDLRLQQQADGVAWDLSAVRHLDSVGAHMLWRVWGNALPARVTLTDLQRDVFDMLARFPVVVPPEPIVDHWRHVRRVGDRVYEGARAAQDMLALFGQVMLDLLRMLRFPARGPWREISAQVYHTGTQALGITALVGFLIGVVLSYLSAQQLKLFGADRLIVTLLGVSITRELGPVLAAILVAGRSGSAITAQIGVMRVTQELDAMQVMGISHSQRLVLPRMLALSITMPLLVLWTDAMALLGGMIAAQLELGMSIRWFLQELPNAVASAHYWIGLGKGVTFGMMIALVACFFGLRIEPNTESLGRGTTASVVTAITGVILLDAIYAVIFSRLGI
ncbi:ABC transporter permease [Alcaligenaceae bacterium SJ-26]|nr:ABC transporter permease [Alcaligenaceae bacterium SJ-26]